MKNLLKTIFVIIITLSLFSCDKEEELGVYSPILPKHPIEILGNIYESNVGYYISIEFNDSTFILYGKTGSKHEYYNWSYDYEHNYLISVEQNITYRFPLYIECDYIILEYKDIEKTFIKK